MNNLSERLIEVMAELGIKLLRDLSTFCGVSKGLVSQWFSGYLDYYLDCWEK